MDRKGQWIQIMAYHCCHVIVIVDAEYIGVEAGNRRVFRSFPRSRKFNIMYKPFHVFRNFLNGLSPKKQAALLALLTNPTKEKAAAAAGITPKTLRSYLAEPEFQAEYKKAFAGLVEDATRQAQQAIAPALSALRDVVEDSSGGPQFRISAARSILEYSLKLTEQNDILSQLHELEEAMKSKGV